MTKFILHGGFKQEGSSIQEDDKFFGEILNNTLGSIKILLVYFAENNEKVQKKFKEDCQQLYKNNKSKNIHTKIAKQETFKQDCEWADVIYLHGGSTAKLLGALKQYKNLEKLFTNKTVAGDSAGVKVLGKYFHSDRVDDNRGLGILPYKIVAHHVDGNQNPLVNIAPELETIFLKEYETKVIEL